MSKRYLHVAASDAGAYNAFADEDIDSGQKPMAFRHGFWQIWPWRAGLRSWRGALVRGPDGGVGRARDVVQRARSRARSTLMAMGFAAAAVLSPTVAFSDDALESVQRIYAFALETASRPDKLARGLATSVDLEAVALKTLGAAYSKAPLSERDDFKQVLLHVIARELSQRIRGKYQFEITRTRTLQGGDVVVFSRLTQKNDVEKLLDWRMRPCGSRYCIYDLISNNASFSASLRTKLGARLETADASVSKLTQELRAEMGLLN